MARTDGTMLPPGSATVLGQMAEALRPRGPDDMQFAELGAAAMSFTRLSLIDPECGRQPFVSADGEVVLACNGEIYNHEELRREFSERDFGSRSDCEVLLQLYLRDGLSFLDRVRGMFGVAVIDLKEQRVVLARDRIGLKPMFVCREGPVLLFGSEVKALFQHPACPRRLDWAAALADQGLNAAPMMPPSGSASWFSGIEQIEPGTITTVDLRDGSQSVHRYWSMPEPVAAGELSPGEAVDQLRSLLDESVQECLVADAEIGLMLSGGVDSAGIAALSRGEVGHSFSALTASTLLNGDTDFARSTAGSFGLQHHEVAFAVGDWPSAAEWKRLVWLMESPLCGPEQHFKSELYRAARAARPQLKAMLLGSGADELAGGYSRMLAGGGDWHDFVANLHQLARRRTLTEVGGALGTWWQGPGSLVRDDVIRAAAPGSLGDPYDAFVGWKVRDWQQYNFWVEDRTASGNAVEARVPYLDHRIVELLASVPRAHRQELFWDKQIIRSALSGVVPPEILQRPKIAFYEGSGVRYTHQTFARMLLADDAALIEEALSTPSASQFLDADQIRRAASQVLAGRASTHLELVLRLVNLGLLDAMTQTLPDTVPSAAPAPVEVPPGTGRAEQWDIVLSDAAVTASHTLEFAEDVLLLDDADGASSYLAVAGQLRYVLDADTDASWLAFLRQVRPGSSVGHTMAVAGVELDEISELLEQAVSLGLLRASAPAAGEKHLEPGAQRLVVA